MIMLSPCSSERFITGGDFPTLEPARFILMKKGRRLPRALFRVILAERRCVQQAAIGPLCVQAACQTDRSFLTDVLGKDFAVVAADFDALAAQSASRPSISPRVPSVPSRRFTSGLSVPAPFQLFDIGRGHAQLFRCETSAFRVQRTTSPHSWSP